MNGGLILRVGGLHTIDDDLPSFRPTHLIGILDPAMPPPAAYERHPVGQESLVLRFRDSEAEASHGATAEQIAAIVALIDRAASASAGEASRLFIHCHAGASRSTAVAYLALVRQHGVAAAEAAFAELLRLTRKPWPNRRIVDLGDALFGGSGRLLVPLDAYRRANPLRLEAYIRLHHRRARQDMRYGERLGIADWRPPKPLAERRSSVGKT
jgi:predicted protein tyrosine phosphatase